MNRHWTFGRKLTAGLLSLAALALVSGTISALALRSVVRAEQHVIDVNARNLIDSQKLQTTSFSISAAVRGYLLTHDDTFLTKIRDRRKTEEGILVKLKAQIATDEGRAMVTRIEQYGDEHEAQVSKLLEMIPAKAPADQIVSFYDTQVLPRRDALNREIDGFVSREEGLLSEGERAAVATADTTVWLVTLLVAATIIAAILIAWILSGTLTRQIGSAVQHVQSSSAELQTTANQQATSAAEQATAMSEITTTITELLASSRQIAESAQRVAHIADQTASTARGADQTVQKAEEGLGGIKRQVDQIVSHMLDLGGKSQQIGAILEIVNELSEQTNILAINATIEAAGAGESGRRFAVVAEEIRKLADRVGGSTKEIRALIEEIRAAVNTTVMATESGSKAVEAGSRQFAEVMASLRQIASQVVMTTEATREIELSTKQQSSAVEQVNVASANAAQASRESEVGSRQTLETASQLSKMSTDLSRLV